MDKKTLVTFRRQTVIRSLAAGDSHAEAAKKAGIAKSSVENCFTDALSCLLLGAKNAGESALDWPTAANRSQVALSLLEKGYPVHR
jgi:DNA-binding NarL/FixJ family response regulator